jgi:hypothetical protein
MSDGIRYEVEVYPNGDKEWRLNGERHREDGPAIERFDGHKYWYMNGELHREDGPAVERSNGHKYWYMNGEIHREDGPAIEYPDGDEDWYLNGKEYSKPDYKAEMERRRNTCNGKTVIIEGKEYRLTEVK